MKRRLTVVAGLLVPALRGLLQEGDGFVIEQRPMLDRRDTGADCGQNPFGSVGMGRDPDAVPCGFFDHCPKLRLGKLLGSYRTFER